MEMEEMGVIVGWMGGVFAPACFVDAGVPRCSVERR